MAVQCKQAWIPQSPIHTPLSASTQAAGCPGSRPWLAFLSPRHLFLWSLPLSNQEEEQETASTSSLKSEYSLPRGNMQNTPLFETNNGCAIGSLHSQALLWHPPPASPTPLAEWRYLFPLLFATLSWKSHQPWPACSRMLDTHLRLPLKWPHHGLSWGT